MKVDMVMPQMGESITEATISRWLKAVGQEVSKDEIILEISTDKVDSEIPAPASGVVSELLFSEGDVVPVKEKIAIIDTDSTASADAPASTPAAPEVAEAAPAAPAPPAPHVNGGPQVPTAPTAAHSAPAASAHPAPAASAHSAPAGSGKFFSPLVRSLAESRGLSLAELEQIPGSGRGGRVSKQDLLNYLEQRGEVAPTAAAPVAPVQPQPAAAPVAAQTPPPPAPRTEAPQAKAPVPDMPSGEWGADGTKVVPMDNMRQLIADHMVRSKATSPHVYSVQEVDVSKISQWRTRHKAEFRKNEGFNLSFTPFFLEAAVRGLLQFPRINSSVDGKKVIMKRHINLGCAVALGNEGLIVPVIKNADERNLVGIARSLTDLARRARDKKLLPDEVMGGTFTVTNPGVFGTMIGTPIINQPQVAILCLGAIKKRPVVVDDMIAIREICYLTLSYDHRIVDGALGGQYLAFIREYLENWDMDRPLY